MRSFKTKIRRLLFVVVLILATVFSTNLNTNLASALNISQESLTVSDQSSTITIHDAGIGNFKITPNLEFNRLDDFITYKLVIKNNDGKKYRIVSITDDNTNNAIELSYIYDSSMNINNKEIDLTIKYVQVSQNLLNTVTVTIKLVDEDDDSQNIPIVVPNTSYTTPNTGANTITDTSSATKTTNTSIYIIYTILAGVIIATYIIIRRKYLRNNKSRRNIKIATLSILLLGLIPVIVIAASSQDLQFIIDFSNVSFNGPYTVTFNTNGGTPVPPAETKNYKEKFTEPTTNPTKTGYDFGGWLDQNNQPYDFTTEVTADLTLKAKWNLKTYSINYTLPTGATNPTTNPATYTYEDNDITLAAPTLPNHAFKGWVDKSTPTSPTTVQPSITIPKNSTGDRTYEAVFNPIYTITYDTDGGTAISPNQFTKEKDEKIGTLATTSKDHYDFIGWYIGNDEIDENYKVTGNITIVAHYTPHEYTITYDLDGGTETTNRTKYTIVTSDFTLAEPTPPSSDKAFAGWLDISDPLNPSTTPVKTITITKGTTGNKSFKATYKNFYTVTFDVGASNDTPPQDRIILDGDKIGTLPNGPKPIEFVIYGFDGWYVGDTKIDENHEITDDTTVVAKYVKKTVNNGIEDLVDEDVTDESCVTNNQVGLVVSDDPDGNARYTGKCPSNYVMFNNELWRVVGVFNNIDDGTGKLEKRTKIIRDVPLKNVWGSNMLPAFDVRYENSDPYYQNGGSKGVSQWGNTKLSNGTAVNGAHLQQKLNTDFLNGVSNPETTNGKPNSRWYHTRWNQAQTNNFERYDATQSLDDTARSLIGDAVWNTGAAIYNGSGSKIIASTIYNQERSNNVPTANKAGLVRTTKWTGKVGLLYPSDYLYSPSGDTNDPRGKCIAGDASQQDCRVYTWLAPTSYNEYTITPSKCPSGISCDNTDLMAVWVYAGTGSSIGVMYTTDNVINPGQYYTFRPVVYLKSDVKILSGTGEKTNPFRIGFSNE